MWFVIVAIVILGLCITKQIYDHRNGCDFDVLSYFCFVYELCFFALSISAIPSCSRFSSKKYDFKNVSTSVIGIDLGYSLEKCVQNLEMHGKDFDFEYNYSYDWSNEDKDYKWRLKHPTDSVLLGINVEDVEYLGFNFEKAYFNINDGKVNYIALVYEQNMKELKNVSKHLAKVIDEQFGEPNKGVKFYGKKSFYICDETKPIVVSVTRRTIYKSYGELEIVISQNDTKFGHMPFYEDIDYYDDDEYDRMPF